MSSIARCPLARLAVELAWLGPAARLLLRLAAALFACCCCFCSFFNFCFRCTFMWRFFSSLLANFRLQISQLKGFSPVWVLLWVVRWSLRLKPRAHC